MPDDSSTISTLELSYFGCNTISMLSACTEPDIEHISHDTNIKKIDKLKLKVAIKKMNECDDNKHLIIEMEERNIMMGIDNKIKELQQIIADIDSNQINDIILESKKCEKEINSTFSTLYDSLNKRKDGLLKKVHQICNHKKDELMKRKEEIDECLAKSIHTKQECHKLLNRPTQIEELNDRKQTLRHKARKVIGLKYDINPQKDIVLFKSYLNSLLKIHNKFGSVYGVNYICSDEWDINNCGNKILVNKSVCISSIDNEYQSVFGCCVAIKGIHHWRLKIIKTTYHMLWNTMIGIIDVINKRKVCDTYFTESAHSYAFIGNCCMLQPKCDNEYGTILKNGSIIDVILDCDKHTLKYIIDDKDYGIAYQHIPQSKYCLAVTMTKKDDQIQLMRYLGQQYY